MSGTPEPAPHLSGSMLPLRGLGLWPAVVIDQHFTQRNRESRLMTAVLDRPQLLGLQTRTGAAAGLPGLHRRAELLDLFCTPK